MLHNLPDELWLEIFDMAVDDSSLFEPTLPTAFSEASWFKSLYGDWSLRTAQEEVNSAQRKSYATKKAIMNTCRNWRRLGYEFYYRFLFFSNPRNIQRLCALMDTTKDLGKWTRRLHVTRYFATGGASSETIQNSLVAVIRHCPKLEIFITNWPLSISFSAIANALCTYSVETLRVLQINIPTLSLPKLIYMLQCLPKLEVLHVEFEGAPPEYLPLGAAGDLELNLPCLQHLAIRGPFQDFVEQAIAWRLPSLRLLSLDFINYREDFPDIIEFLTEHGQELTFLDLNCIPPLEVSSILDLCPMLETFTFNPDWRLGGWEHHPFLESHLVNQPHANIKTIGLHHLMYAFGVGYAATYNKVDPFVTQSIRRQNDVNFAALNKRNFPRLERIRVLNPTLLTDLEKNNGPSQACFERWERWSRQCQKNNVRLEDCTGAPLGTLPEVDEEEEDDESVVGEGELHLSTLRELLLECRKMNAEREQETFSPALHMIYAGATQG
ncbi:hypothetical protein BD311DRAFT_746380 [Dichomitus squalens]|uniref:F-box domain-containing protein n=1 Tax=Dichomitus squalens TaxID=114155 RepID=A0A4Q9N5K8_9APHY|nr:hypothetical protein BD311DRAFT_746380 [Dichomitus squalens]